MRIRNPRIRLWSVLLTVLAAPATLLAQYAPSAERGGFVAPINPGFVWTIPPGTEAVRVAPPAIPVFRSIGPTLPLPPGISVTYPPHAGRRSPYVASGTYISVSPPILTETPPVLTGAEPGRAGSVTVGMSRSDVIQSLGTPRARIVRPGGETMMFGPTRVVIENGVVAVVR